LSSTAQPVEPTNRWQDVLAGLSIAGLLLPEAVAYSSIAALAPQGVIALFAGLLCYGLFGTSRFAIVSATSSSAAVLAAATATWPMAIRSCARPWRSGWCWSPVGCSAGRDLSLWQ
jgi:MFS superfamily sulfate permease-like transporter